ncbi:MAG: ribosome biogenesis GTPase Der [Dehalococcoidales bacterium]|nr:ribosome biogenesis GTPase Der [Dehalococcoidales bacterium]
MPEQDMVNESAPLENIAPQDKSAVKPMVAIVGRQNVGKSTLLNRLAGRNISIVEDMPGTTRDRVFADITWHGADFTLVDTGGVEMDPISNISLGVRDQVDIAINEASLIIFLMDARSGLTPTDYEVAEMLRRANKPLLLVINKADSSRLESETAEFYKLGLGEPIAISAYHGRGTAELLDKIVSMLPPPAPVAAGPAVMKVAIVGRPGVGKSMLLNTLVGSKRAIVGDTPGTTRDAIDTLLDFDGQSVLLIDTAGIRRRGKILAGVEKYSVGRSLRAIDRADVVLLVMDASEQVTAQDTHIGGYVQQATKGIVLVVNKWDLVEEKNQAEWNEYLMSQFKFMSYAPVLYTSAKTGEGVDKLLPMARQVYQERQKRLPTPKVNNVIREAIAVHGPPQSGTKRLKILYATQAEINPPTFVFFANDAKLVHFSYRRYLENRLRQAFGFTGTAIRLVFRSRGDHDN